MDSDVRVDKWGWVGGWVGDSLVEMIVEVKSKG